MQIAPLLRSASFRLAAAYAVLFSVSVGILATVVYWSVTTEFDHQLRARIQVESTALRAEYISGGVQGLFQAIRERQRERFVGGLDYALYDRRGVRVFGNTPSVRCGGWTTIAGPPDGDEPDGELEQVLVATTPLPNGFCLVVGDDIGKVARVGSLILRSFGWVFVLSLSLAIGGGMLLSSQVWQRIEAIIRTAEGIIEGDLSQRVPRRPAPDDLDRLAATLNRMLDRMTGLMESLRHVSNDVAHDLRTPLGRLRHRLEEGRETAQTREDYQATLDAALTEIDGILDTFAAILRIAQIESGQGRSGFRQLSFSDLVEDVCQSYTPSFEDADKVLIADVEPGLALRGDPDLLAQSLANLLENAIRHTPGGTTVIVSAARRDCGIALTVADDGAGIPDGEHARIFERFYRLDDSRSVAGNGLGLSIVAAIAALHDAEVRASSNQPGLKVKLQFSTGIAAAA